MQFILFLSLRQHKCHKSRKIAGITPLLPAYVVFSKQFSEPRVDLYHSVKSIWVRGTNEHITSQIISHTYK